MKQVFFAPLRRGIILAALLACLTPALLLSTKTAFAATNPDGIRRSIGITIEADENFAPNLTPETMVNVNENF